MTADKQDLATRAVDAAMGAALNAIREYAAQFEKREDYEPLEDLAARAAFDAGIAGVNVIREENGLDPIEADYDEVRP